jgi:predicted Zn-dependent protease
LLFSRVAEIDDALGWILLAQGEADKALTYLSAASVTAPKNPDIQYHLAVALNRLGRTADAQTMLAKLLGSGATFTGRAETEKLLQHLKANERRRLRDFAHETIRIVVGVAGGDLDRRAGP